MNIRAVLHGLRALALSLISGLLICAPTHAVAAEHFGGVGHFGGGYGFHGGYGGYGGYRGGYGWRGGWGWGGGYGWGWGWPGYGLFLSTLPFYYSTVWTTRITSGTVPRAPISPCLRPGSRPRRARSRTRRHPRRAVPHRAVMICLPTPRTARPPISRRAIGRSAATGRHRKPVPAPERSIVGITCGRRPRVSRPAATA